LWKVCTDFITELKEQILSRDGKLVIRPDSGDPVDIICGTQTFSSNDEYVGNRLKWGSNNVAPTKRGVIELLWDVFGGTINEQGYKVLDSHIGAILGDGVTLERAEIICQRLKLKGFSSTNIVLGIGSYSMGYCTRDNQGSAMKATYVELDKPNSNGEMEKISRDIFKDPITDDGLKKSATGLLKVVNESDRYILLDKQTWEEEKGGILQTIYEDGKFYNQTTLTEIRERINKLVDVEQVG
jgi:nicotinamide phosphoribosyltransferase